MNAQVIFIGVVFLLFVLFAGTYILDLVEYTWLSEPTSGLNEGNVTGTWAEVGGVIMVFFVMIIIVLGIIALLIGRGDIV